MDNFGGENGRRLEGASAEELGSGGRLMLRGPIGRITEVLPSIGQLCSGAVVVEDGVTANLVATNHKWGRC